MREGWACADCRSFNSVRTGRCYKCGAKRSLADLQQGATERRGSWTVEERAARTGARYWPSWPLAAVLMPLILASTAAELVYALDLGSSVNGLGALVVSEQDMVGILAAGALGSGLFLVALVVWSAWIALVVHNIPAVTATRPARGPVAACLAPWVPFLQAWRPYSTVRSTMIALSDGRLWPPMIALAWWAFVLGSVFVPVLAAFREPSSPDREAALVQSLTLYTHVRTFFWVPAGILAVAVVASVEWSQLSARDRRRTAVAPLGGKVPPA